MVYRLVTHPLTITHVLSTGTARRAEKALCFRWCEFLASILAEWLKQDKSNFNATLTTLPSLLIPVFFVGAPGWAATPLLLSDNSAILVYSVRLGQAVLERLLSGRCLFENPRFFTQGAYSDISGATSRDGGVRERVGRTLQFHGGGNNPRRSEDCQNRTPASLATSIEVHKLGPGLQAIPAPEKVTELSVSPLGEGPISPALTYARSSVYFEAGYAQRASYFAERPPECPLPGAFLDLYQREALLRDSRSLREDSRSLRERERSVVRPAFAESGSKNRLSQASQR